MPLTVVPESYELGDRVIVDNAELGELPGRIVGHVPTLSGRTFEILLDTPVEVEDGKVWRQFAAVERIRLAPMSRGGRCV